MLKSIKTSLKAEIRKKTAVEYDFSKVLYDIPEMNKVVNNRIQEYEECQTLSVRRASHIRSR